MDIKKEDVFLIVLPIIMEKGWDKGRLTTDMAKSAMEITDEIMSVINKTSKSNPNLDF